MAGVVLRAARLSLHPRPAANRATLFPRTAPSSPRTAGKALQGMGWWSEIACRFTTLAATGAEAIGVPTDVGDRAALHTLAETTWERFGGAHIVFNNAGVAAYGAATELTHADWEWSLQINLWSAIYGVETFLPRLLAQNLPAHILFTASFAGLVVSKNMTSYNVAKAAVVALAESLAKDLYNSSIGVSVLCPMRVATNVWETSPRSRPLALGGAQAFRRRPAEVTAGMAGEILDVDYVAQRVLDGVQAARRALALGATHTIDPKGVPDFDCGPA
jgi:NAD(P)-dependent dehydrogenase (short-subunit alcohol dehydrogenase family)